LPQIIKTYDEPFGDFSQVPTFLLAQFARRDVTVVLTGDGGDELFQGYNRHVWLAKYNWIYRLPKRFRFLMGQVIKANSRLVSRMLNFISKHSMSNLQKQVQDLADAIAAPESSIGYAKVVENGGVNDLLHKKYWSNYSTKSYTKLRHKQWALNDINSYLTDGVLVKVDRACMAHSLESRVPFLDHELAARAWATPSELNICHLGGKGLLRDLLSNELGLGVDKMPKRGFTLPLSEWLRGPLDDWVDSLLCSEQLARHNFFRFEKVQDLIKQHRESRADNTQLIWNLIVFQSWADTLESRIKY
jgi:asparagine synthase (glutamine-hydrolysing)